MQAEDLEAMMQAVELRWVKEIVVEATEKKSVEGRGASLYILPQGALVALSQPV